MHQMFCNIAETDSDCGSHERGGDLGMFGKGMRWAVTFVAACFLLFSSLFSLHFPTGQMQKAFEEVGILFTLFVY